MIYNVVGGNGGGDKSIIVVTAPTGSTVTCTKGSTVKTATEKNGTWTFRGLDLGTWVVKATKGSDSASQTVAISRLTVVYISLVYRITPEFSYTGDYEIVNDDDTPIADFANHKGNWKIRFLTSGTLRVTKLNGVQQIDVFLVGGGGSGGCRSSSGVSFGGGAGSGYTTTVRKITLNVGVDYKIVIGAGGSPVSGNEVAGKNGGNTTAFGSTANGGQAGGVGNQSTTNGGNGGSGGGSGHEPGVGGTDGANGKGPRPGTGQGKTTREFADVNGKLYATGGDGGKAKIQDVVPNTGDGGDGKDGTYPSGAGASGIVVIRNAR